MQVGSVLSAMTLRSAEIEERVRAAAAAGFHGIGLRVDDYVRARARGWSDEAMRELLAHHRLRVHEVELLRSWGRPGSAAAREEEDLVFHMAAVFGARSVNAGLPDGEAGADLAPEYARLCRRAEAAGLVVPLEFMPYGAIPSLRRALDIVERAGRPGGGLLIDTWHCHRTGLSAEHIAALDPDAVLSVQICDTRPDPHPDPRHEARHLRLLPGEGTADIHGILRALLPSQRVASVAVEVMSDELDAMDCAAVAQQARTALDKALAGGGWAV
ncbi:sugar phosphate isomerase/epimerase [Streptomyces sp. B1866]|uniref:sugar phosphate isomerase/epimerase family protein n=1 Tax=Streptomyces sp. B1866 TaxID=3075431 RepID=UPI00288D3701|nr:sugar phosphate isomerase/epimerase [Streptomyces sp. B1866]MDT3396528.1 sugar phosphate isomerase/epimerase [Streptomyces sp. B1866]